MTLDSLHILNYKNITQTDLVLDSKVNCFIGLNGMGKTNLLDTIYYLSFCKSHTNVIDSENIRHGSDFFLLQGCYTRLGQQENIVCSIKRRQKKHFSRNKREYQKLSDHIGFIPLVLISPADTELIHGGSEFRRKFADGIISQVDKEYLDHLLKYGNALRQRNAMLKMDSMPSGALFDTWEEQMVVHAIYIHRRREEFIKEFTPYFSEYYSLISGGGETVSLSYESQLAERDLAQMLSSTRERDHMIGYTTHGVHKDDLMMNLGDYPIRRVGSQGQCKSYVIALKFAQYQYLRRALSINPIILLDDLFDKLDAHRMGQILSIVCTPDFGQIFITDTDRSHLDTMLDTMGLHAKVFNISNGDVVC